MNNEGLRIIEDVTTLPGLQWVEAPMDATSTLRLQLPEPEQYSSYFEPRSDGRGVKLSDAGRAMVDANWFGFRNMGGMADSWDSLKNDPDRIGQRIDALESSRGVMFESLHTAAQGNPDAQKVIRLMENSFKRRTEGMRTTRLNAEIEAGNSPWKDILEETTNRFVKENKYANLRRGAALSHIQAKRRKIEEITNEIVDTDDRFSNSDKGRLRTHIENRYVEKANVGFSQILPGNMKGLGIDKLDNIVERASATQVGTSLDISVFYKQSAEEFLDDKKQDHIAKVDARHIKVPERRRLSVPAKLAFAGVGMIILGTAIVQASGGFERTPKTDLRNNMNPRNDKPGYVLGNLSNPLGVDLHHTTPTQEAPIYNYTNSQEDEGTILDQGENIISTPPPFQEVEVMDDAGDGGESEITLNDGLFEIDGVDFSQDYQIIIPSEWAQYIGVSDQDHLLSLSGDGHEKGTAMTEEDFSYQSDDTTATMAALSSAMGKNFVIQGHSYVVDSLLNNPEESDKKIEDYPFEPIRRLVEYILSTGQIPEDVLNSPITIIQGGREVQFTVVNAQKLPVVNFSIMNYYSDPKLPATFQLGPDRLDLTGEGSVGTGEDVAQQGAIHLVTCTGNQELVKTLDGGTTYTFNEQAILTLRLVADESQNDQATEGLPSVDEVVLSPTFASEFGTDFQTQYLSELASSRPELVKGYELGTNSRNFLEKLFRDYEPASSALKSFVETNNLQTITEEEQLTAYLYTQNIVTGASVDNYLKVGRYGSHGSSFGMIVPSGVTDGQWVQFAGIMYRSDSEIDPLVIADETFQPLLYQELIGDNEDAMRRWGYDETSTVNSLDNSNLRALVESIQKFYMANNGLYDESYQFRVNGVETYDPRVAGNQLAQQLSGILGREVSPEELLTLVNRTDFNRLMDELRLENIKLEELVGMHRNGTRPLNIDAKYPASIASTTN